MNTKLVKKQQKNRTSSGQASSSWAQSLPLLPPNPGVYWFLNEENKVIYVGKAKNLKNRIKSYTHINQLYDKTKKLVTSANKVKFQTLDTEYDALIVEAELIKLHQPKYNIRLKDDKTPIYIYISDHKYPKIKISRKNKIPKSIKKTNIFGPFSSAYATKKLIKFIRKSFPFCNASDMQIKNKTACFYSHIDLCDGICKGEESKKHYQQKIKKISQLLHGKKSKLIRHLKKEINIFIINKEFEKANQNKKIVQNLTSSKTNIITHQLPNLTQDKAEESLKNLRKILRKLISLPPDYPLSRIEGYDISNTQGSLSTASMVVFTNGIPDKSEYKRFKIKTVKGPNDQAMIGEVINRRSKRSEWGIPNLLVIDGGKTQLTQAINNCSWNIPIISIVKNPDSILFKIDKKYYKIKLGKNTASNLLTSIRDESHRFAKSYHSILRNKKLFDNE